MQKNDTNIIPLTLSASESQTSIMLREIERQYTKNTQIYLAELQQYTFEIKKCRDKLETLQSDVQKSEILRRPIEDEIYYQQRQLEKLNEAFMQKIHHIEEIEEQSNSDIKNNLCEKHKKELAQLVDEIEEGEIILLEQELQRLNHISVIDPMKNKINQLDAQLKELILQKELYETTKISKISMFSAQHNEKEELVDIDIIEEDMDKNISII